MSLTFSSDRQSQVQVRSKLGFLCLAAAGLLIIPLIATMMKLKATKRAAIRAAAAESYRDILPSILGSVLGGRRSCVKSKG
jgi:hypothetical protein